MFFLLAATAVTAGLSQAIAWDNENKSRMAENTKSQKFVKGVMEGDGMERVTPLPEFILIEDQLFGSPILMTGREAIWWSREGFESRDTEATQRKIRWVYEQRAARAAMVTRGEAGVTK